MAGWAIYLSRDLPHGMYRLAAGRLVPPALAGTLAGAAASILIALLLGRLARAGLKWLQVGMAFVSLGYVTVLILAAIPLRPILFPLRIFSGKPLSVGVFAGLAGILGALLLARFRAARSSAPGPSPADSGMSPRASPAAFCGAGLGVLTMLAGVALRLTPPERPAQSRSVILVCLDTLRADRLGILGNERGLTPRLDSLAREGVVFEQADSAAPWTLPSHASLFTSILPYDHGARWDSRPLRPAVATLAERFREAGYLTASFNGGAYVSAHLGLDQGFQIYEEHDEVREGGPERIMATSLAWMRSAGDAPFFVFIHTYEVHTPLTHHEMADPADAGRLAGTFGFQEVAAVESQELVLTPAERRYVSGLYDSDVAYADKAVGGLLQALGKDGVLDKAILVVLADHGEELWDHGSLRSPAHGHSLYEEVLRVPLFFRAPGLVRAGVRIRTPVSLLDVAPTLLSLTGLPPDPDHQGHSLERAVREGREPPLQPIYAESNEYGPSRFSLRQGDLKIIVAPAPDEINAGVGFPVNPVEVFDLGADPGEASDRSASVPPGAAATMQSLWRRVRRVYAPLRENQIDDQDLPERLREQLRSLGYVH